jgi:hypothetical protein
MKAAIIVTVLVVFAIILIVDTVVRMRKNR